MDGRRGIVFERVEGPELTMALLSRPWRFPKLAGMMAELHARMHACELPELTSHREDLKRIIRNRLSLPEDNKEGLLNILEQLPDGNTLCHGDFHPENILMTAQGPIIIDWWTAKRGNPLADVARTSLLLHVGTPPDVGAFSKQLHNMGGSLLYSFYSRKYLRLIPASRKEIDDWLPLVAAARLAAEAIPGEKEQLLTIIKTALSS